ncbi:MAG: spike base protein, RCAP_Rcc01079 family [Methyloligellaceae bacterium]
MAIKARLTTHHTLSQSDPARGAFVITPDNNADLEELTRALYIGVAGDLSVVMQEGQTVTFPNVEVGIFPIRVARVNATNTTASSIIGMV